MAITFEGTPTRATVATGTLTIDQPTVGVTVANSDYLHIIVERDDNVSLVTLPTGWVLWDNTEQLEGAGTDKSCFAARKLITNAAGEPSNYSFSWDSDTSEPSVGTIWVIRGADVTNIEDAEAIYSSQRNSGTPDCEAITTVTDGAVVMAFAGCVNDDGSSDPTVSGATFPANYTASGGSTDGGFDTAGTGSRDPQWLACYREITTAGIEDPASFDGLTDDTNDWQCLTIAIRPASAASNAVIDAIGDFDAVFDNELRVLVQGDEFESVQGTGTADINDTDELNGNEVAQTVRSWTDRDIELDFDKGAFVGLTDNLFLIITTDGGVEITRPVTVQDSTGNPQVRLQPPPQTFELGVSFNLAAGDYIWDSNAQESLIFTGSGLVPGLSVSGTFIQGTIDADAGDNSPYTTTITATDPDGAEAEDTFTHTIDVSSISKTRTINKIYTERISIIEV